MRIVTMWYEVEAMAASGACSIFLDILEKSATRVDFAPQAVQALSSGFFNLRGQIEVFRGESAGVVGGKAQPHAVVADIDVGMVTG